MLTWRKIFDDSIPSNRIKASRRFVLGAALVSLTTSIPQFALAQSASSPDNPAAFAPRMIEHAQKMRKFGTAGDPQTTQSTPSAIPQTLTTSDSTGQLQTFQPS